MEEWMKDARSYRTDEYPEGACVAEYVTDTEIYYFYEQEKGVYRYTTAADALFREKVKKKRKIPKVVQEMINIYIDVDMKGFKGKADYGYFLEWERPGRAIETREGFGAAEDTRNRVFLIAAIEALGRINKAEEVHVYAPCQYMVESANKGLPEIWMLHAWIKGDKSEVKNKDLWEKLLPFIRELKPVWHDGAHAYSEVIARNIKERKKWNCKRRGSV